MNYRGEPAFPIIPQPMALAADALSRPSRKPPVPSNLVDKPRRRQQQQRSVFFNEDIFSRVLGGPLLIVHFALYCVVPVIYLAYFSPFSHFRPGTFSQTMRLVLLCLTQCLTAVLAVSWDGRLGVRKELTTILYVTAAVFVVGGLKTLVDGLTAQRGHG